MVLGMLFSTKWVELNEDNKKALDEYKYKGGDNGICYRYLHSPLAEIIASWMPMWLAPNVITLIAAMCLVIPHILTVIFYGRSFEGPVESWVTVVYALAQFSYFTLDNVDGKQARRTGSSSPLGQMFDHGCDAMTFNLWLVTTCRFTQMGSGYLTFFYVSFGCIGYFMFNLKEYYMGEYYLQVINPISEGSVVGLMIVLYWGYIGWEAVQVPWAFGYSFTQLFWLFIIVSQIYQNLEMLVEIIMAKKYEMPFKMTKFIADFSSFMIFYILCVLLAFYSPNDYVNDKIDGGRGILYIMIFGNSYIVLQLMIGHLGHKKFDPFRSISFALSWVLISAFILLWNLCPEVVKPFEGYFLYSLGAYLAISSLSCFVSIVRQMESHLKIQAFRIKTKQN